MSEVNDKSVFEGLWQSVTRYISPITIKGEDVDQHDDVILLDDLRKSYNSSHSDVDIDDDIDAREAFALLDTDVDGFVDAYDVNQLVQRGFTYEQIQRSVRLFEEKGIEVKHDPSLDGSERDFLLRLAGSKPSQAIEILFHHRDVPYVEEVIRKVAMASPASLLGCSGWFRGMPFMEELIREAAAADPQTALVHSREIGEQQPYGAAVVEKAARTLAEMNPKAAFELWDRYDGQPYKAAVIEKAARTAAEKDPNAAFDYAILYADRPYALEVLEKATENDPQGALESFDHFSYLIKKLLQKSTKPACRFILDISRKLPRLIAGDVAALIDDIVAGRMTYEEALALCQDAHGVTAEDILPRRAPAGTRLPPSDFFPYANPDKFFRALLKITSRNGHLGVASVDRTLGSLSLWMVQRMNDLHNEPDGVRFKAVEGVNAKTLYTLMVRGEEELFTSTFNGLFSRLLTAMKKEGVSGEKLLAAVGHDRFRSFVKLCASYNRLDEFLGTMSAEARKALLTAFVADIEKTRAPLAEAMILADTFSVLKDGAIIGMMQEAIRKEYERVDGEGMREGRAIYSLLAGMFGSAAVINEAWTQEMSEKYHIDSLGSVPQKSLFNADGTNIQQHFFYDDRDGASSFQSFLAHYNGKSGWKTEDRGTYVVVSSPAVGGKRIEIYANKPTREGVERGPDDIQKAFEKRKIESIVVVHRGHSYHAAKTIARIPKIAKIVSLGSCGGYRNVAEVLDRAPSAHIISTKGTGTMLVNDPLLLMLNEAILAGDIDWPTFWAKTEKQLGAIRSFGYYIPPHKNLGIIFLKAYRKLVGER